MRNEKRLGRPMKTVCVYCGIDIDVKPKFRLQKGGKQPLADPRIQHLQECHPRFKKEIRLRDHFNLSEKPE